MLGCSGSVPVRAARAGRRSDLDVLVIEPTVEDAAAESVRLRRRSKGARAVRRHRSRERARSRAVDGRARQRALRKGPPKLQIQVRFAAGH
jgi:hypothetical protein